MTDTTKDRRFLRRFRPALHRVVYAKHDAEFEKRWVEYESMPDGHRLCPRCRREDSL